MTIIVEAKMATFHERLKELRKKNNLTQTELSEAMHTTKGTVSIWERGVRKPDFVMFEQLADYFDVSLDYLLGNSDDATPRPQPADTDAIMHDEFDEYTDFVYVAKMLAQVSSPSLKTIQDVVTAFYRSDKSKGNLRDLSECEYFNRVEEKLMGN
jgi:transcriptional regulator with XRE-family HTH domain